MQRRLVRSTIIPSEADNRVRNLNLHTPARRRFWPPNVVSKPSQHGIPHNTARQGFPRGEEADGRRAPGEQQAPA